MPQQIDMPVLKDAKGGGAMAARRKWPRGLSSWELAVPGTQELLDPILGLLEYAQGDTPIYFDGAGFGEMTSPILLFIGDGVTTDITLPHRFWSISATVIYTSGGVDTGWLPLANDMTWMDSIRMAVPPAVNAIITGKSRRKVKCLLRVEDKPERQRQFRSFSGGNLANIHGLRFFLDEIAV